MTFVNFVVFLLLSPLKINWNSAVRNEKLPNPNFIPKAAAHVAAAFPFLDISVHTDL